jgi:uncharacterized membrane protein YdjX (TVP38/TMEM64 family)
VERRIDRMKRERSDDRGRSPRSKSSADVCMSDQDQLGWHLRWRAMVLLGMLGVAILAAAACLGHYADEELLALERWIAELGIGGPLVLVALMVISTCLFAPDMPFAMAAGALFGLAIGTVCTVAAALIAASLSFWLSRLLLRDRVLGVLARHPRLSAIEQAASREGVRLQLLLRLTPLHAASLSYATGASRVRFGAFLIGCLGMVPLSFVEVYFGYLASHVAKLAVSGPTHSTIHTVVTILGFAASVVVMVYVAHLAYRAVKLQSRCQTESPRT